MKKGLVFMMVMAWTFALSASASYASDSNLTISNKTKGDYVSRKDRGLVRDFKPFHVESDFWNKELDRSGLRGLGKGIKKAVWRNPFADIGNFFKNKDDAYQTKYDSEMKS